MKHYGDITKINGTEIEAVDIITGGSPCQDLSVAGKRAGMSLECTNPDCDFTIVGNAGIKICPKCGSNLTFTRSGLFMEQIRLIKEMRDATDGKQPRYMVWENVFGTFSSNKGEDFRAVLEETAKITDKDAIIPEPPKGKWTPAGLIVGNGWSIAWRVHDSQWWGVPQRRKRVCLLADFNGDTAGKILFELRREASDGKSEQTVGHSGRESRSKVQSVVKSLPGDIKQGKEAGEGTSRGVREGFDETGRALSTLNDQSVCAFEPGAASRIRGHVYEDGVAGTVRANAGDNQQAVVYGGTLSTLNDQPVCYRKGTHPHTKEEPQKREQTEINDTLNAFDNEENRTPTVVVSQDAYDKYTQNDKSASLKANGGNYGGGVREPDSTVGALCARDYKGVGNQYVDEGKLVIS